MKNKLFLLMVLLCAGGLLHAQTIIVDSPAGGVTWCIGQPQTITWSCSGTNVRRVTIDLRSGSTTALVISPETSNTGSFPWTIPASVTPGSYQVRVSLWSSSIGGVSRAFTISACGTPPPTPRPAINVTSPAAGVTWNNGTGYTIRWTPTGTMNANVRVQLFQGAASVLDISPTTANNGSLPWTVPPSVAAGSYFVRVSTVDNLVHGDSRPFNIASLGYMATVILPPIQQPAIGIPVPTPCDTNRTMTTDLVLENVRFEGEPSAKHPTQYFYEFAIRNAGPRCIDSLSWKMIGKTFCCKACPSANYDSSKGQWVLQAGERKIFRGVLIRGKEIEPCGFDSDWNQMAWVKIIVDPNNDVEETNENNNETKGPGCTADGFVILPFY